jgi:hypothetical protein
MDDLELADGRRIRLHARKGRPGARTLIILHGMERDAARYLSQWAALDDDMAFNLIAPEFDQDQFPGWRGYNLGGDGTEFGAVFTALSQIADAAGGADFYGHSAGAQVLQRYVLFGDAPDALFIAANAGWYTAPEDVAFPYGLKDGPPTNLRTAFSRRLVLLNGGEDTDSTHRGLRHDENTDRQGNDRLARAEWMMECACKAANDLNAPLFWKRAVAPDAGHSNRAMAPAALRLLMK